MKTKSNLVRHVDGEHVESVLVPVANLVYELPSLFLGQWHKLCLRSSSLCPSSTEGAHQTRLRASNLHRARCTLQSACRHHRRRRLCLWEGHSQCATCCALGDLLSQSACKRLSLERLHSRVLLLREVLRREILQLLKVLTRDILLLREVLLREGSPQAGHSLTGLKGLSMIPIPWIPSISSVHIIHIVHIIRIISIVGIIRNVLIIRLVRKVRRWRTLHGESRARLCGSH